jgi:CBS domain-containing protein
VANSVREVMTASPLTMSGNETLVAAARQMRDADVGDVIVSDGDSMRGIVTDRDIVVRAIAEELDPRTTTLADVCTHDVVTLDADDPIDQAVKKMRSHAVRRLPVTEGGKLVGVVSLGDLAVERDSDSALADISAAEPNN